MSEDATGNSPVQVPDSRINARIDRRLDGFSDYLINVRIDEMLNARIQRHAAERLEAIGVSLSEDRIDSLIDKRLGNRLDERIDWRVDSRIDALGESLADDQPDPLVDARIDARVYQWFDERIDTIISARIARGWVRHNAPNLIIHPIPRSLPICKAAIVAVEDRPNRTRRLVR